MEFIDEVSDVNIVSLGDALLKFKLPQPKEKSKIQFSYQELGKQMENWFPKNQRGLMWSLFYKYGESQIRDAYSAIRKTDKHSVPYLIGILKNTK